MHSKKSKHPLELLPVLCTVSLLAACGGGSGDSTADSDTSSSTSQSAAVTTGTVTFQTSVASVPAEVATLTVTPTFRLAPVVLDEPTGENQALHTQYANGVLRSVTAKTFSAGTLRAMRSNTSDTSVSPAADSAVATYTPAQIRAAYDMPSLPASGTTPTAAQAAQMGAGQTIYIVDAKHDPNVVAELSAFNEKFGLTTCSTLTIDSTASLPLASASQSACEFAVVYSTTDGEMTGTVPDYDSSWATEIALDVQWAHATAPLARIVLIEAPDSSVKSLAAGVALANKMGSGVVSMSFGAAEGSWTSSMESAFSGTDMTYLAATGDWQAGVYWPAVSANVLAVGGTTLTYSGSGARSETGWEDTGGGVSAYTATPSYQNSNVPGLGNPAYRTVADVSFNADPNTGQYVAVIEDGSSTVQWLSAGGTSLSTPQWAGLIASANAMRVAASGPVLGIPHEVLYQTIGADATTYSDVFADVTDGSNGTCSICSAGTGFDTLTGLGTPNVTSLFDSLVGATAQAAAPVVSDAAVSGTEGTALSFTVSVKAGNAVTWSLSGAPSGMSIDSDGVVSWPDPVAGSYSVTFTATDTVTGQSGEGVYTVTIEALAEAPVVQSATISGKSGVALSFTVSTTSSTPVTYALAGAPSGMSIGSDGVVSWSSPVTGTYSVTVTATSTTTGLSGQGVYTVEISSSGPTLTATGTTGTAGEALTGTVSVSDPGATSLKYSISGVPSGMQFSLSGTDLVYTWASPRVGTYTLKVTVTDNNSLSAQISVPITVK